MLERNWLTFVTPFWKGILVEIFSPRWPSTGKNSIRVGVTTPIKLGDWTFCADYTRLAKRLGFVKKLVPQQFWSFKTSSKLKLQRTEIVQNCWTWVLKLLICWSYAVINLFATRFALLRFALLRFAFLRFALLKCQDLFCIKLLNVLIFDKWVKSASLHSGVGQ